MRIQTIGKGMEVGERMHAQVERKIGKLDRYLKKETDVMVTLLSERNTHVIEVTIPMNGIVLRAEEISSESMNAALDLVVDKLVRQIRKHKTRLSKRLRDDAFGDRERIEPIPVEALLESDDDDEMFDASMGKVVRTKRFAIKPMSVEEAMMQMDLLGHSFFMFLNADTEEVNVLYNRKDGDYGLIEPEFDE